jgi:hypothetical protein
VATEIWLPDDLRREQQVEGQLELARHWNGFLKAIDPELSLVLAKDRAEYPLVPGRWHVRRKNRGAPDSYMPITGPNGEYREPDSGVLDELGRRDSWRTRDGLDRFLREKHATEDQLRKERELRREQLRDELADDFRAARRGAGDEALDEGRKAWGRGGKDA